MLKKSNKSEKNMKKKLSNQKTRYRNSKQSLLQKANTNTSSKPSLKEKIDLVGQRTSTFLYNMKKRQTLNILKEQTRKVSVYMNKLGNSFKAINFSINRESNPLMISNLTNVNFRRSLFIRKQLRNIDKMNVEFDKEYNPLNLIVDTNNKYKNYELSEIDEEYKDKIKKEKKIRDENFKNESMKIFNILFKKNRIDGAFSDYKKNKKLNELKSNIDYVCGVEENEQTKNKPKDPSKVPHYTIQLKSPSFIREKSKNASFTPSIKYNKSKIYFSKKYELSQERIDKSKKLFEKLNNTIQISPKKPIKYKIKSNNIILKTEQNINKNSSKYLFSPIKKFSHEEGQKSKIKNLFFKNNININSHKKDNSFNNNLPEIKNKKYNNNIFKTIPNNNRNIFTFSPKLRNHQNEKNLIFPQKQNFSSKDLHTKRCKTANQKIYIKNNPNEYSNTEGNSNLNSITNTYSNINTKSNSNITNKKKFFPILKNLLDDNYNLKKDLKLGFNIITNMVNDFKENKKKKVVKNEINIEKIRKELKLYNINNVIDEIDVVMNNVRKMEKLVKKKDIYLLRQVAKGVIREDKLANKNLVFDNNNINTKLKKLYERKNKNNNQDSERDGTNLDEQERNEIKNLFKNDGPDFNSETYLANLIKRYKTMKVK